MERMLAALEPVAPTEGFAAVFDDESATLAQILSHITAERKGVSHEYCHEAR